MAHHNSLGICRQLKIHHLNGLLISRPSVFLYGDRKLVCRPVFAVFVERRRKNLRRKIEASIADRAAYHGATGKYILCIFFACYWIPNFTPRSRAAKLWINCLTERQKCWAMVGFEPRLYDKSRVSKPVYLNWHIKLMETASSFSYEFLGHACTGPHITKTGSYHRWYQS